MLVLHNVDPAWEAYDQAEARRFADQLAVGLQRQGHRVALVEVNDRHLRARLSHFDPSDWLVLNACESLPGVQRSDVLVADELSEMGYTYTGAPQDVLSRSWDKPLVKRLLAREGVPTPDAMLCPPGEARRWQTFPAIVKPAYEHSSLGVTREAVVLNHRELRARIAYIVGTYLQPALVEDMIDGREFHVTIWGDGLPKLLPLAEMDFSAFGDVHDRVCTYDSKFVPGSSAYQGIGLRLPAKLVPSEMLALRKAALGAYRAVGCRDYARLDIRQRNGTFYVLDVNPNPDISAEASSAAAAEFAGYSYGAFASQLVRLAARRHPRHSLLAGAAEPRHRLGPPPAHFASESWLHT